MLCTSFGGFRVPVPNTGRPRCASVSANLEKPSLGGFINTQEHGGFLDFYFNTESCSVLRNAARNAKKISYRRSLCTDAPHDPNDAEAAAEEEDICIGFTAPVCSEVHTLYLHREPVYIHISALFSSYLSPSTPLRLLSLARPFHRLFMSLHEDGLQGGGRGLLSLAPLLQFGYSCRAVIKRV